MLRKKSAKLCKNNDMVKLDSFAKEISTSKMDDLDCLGLTTGQKRTIIDSLYGQSVNPIWIKWVLPVSEPRWNQ